MVGVPRGLAMTLRRPEPTPPVDPGADRRGALALVPVSRETEERLTIYAERLAQWQAIKNLVGPATLPELWTRHIADSAQLLAFAPEARRWVDLGSGAGFPGLVIAIMLADTAGAHVELVESNNRKCAFLREVARDTGAPVTIHAGRIEAVVPALAGPVDVVTSRALAGVGTLVAMAEPLLRAGALGLFLAGEGSETLGPGWRVDTAASKTHPRGMVLLVRSAPSWENGA